jgi:hypothetical protein
MVTVHTRPLAAMACDAARSTLPAALLAAYHTSALVMHASDIIIPVCQHARHGWREWGNFICTRPADPCVVRQ